MKQNLLLLFALLPFFIHSQNLVVNGNAEDHRDCPNGPGQYRLATGWLSPTTGTPDYFNDCSTQLEYGTEFNKKGGQIAHSGSAYLGFQSETMHRTEFYEYLETALNEPLQADTEYCVRFFVSLGRATAALTEIGVAFSQVELKNLSPNKIRIPYLALRTGSALSDSLNWVRLSGTYKARGGERYLTIGDFSPQGSFSLLPTGTSDTSVFRCAYYFVDDVSVEKAGHLPCGQLH